MQAFLRGKFVLDWNLYLCARGGSLRKYEYCPEISAGKSGKNRPLPKVLHNFGSKIGSIPGGILISRSASSRRGIGGAEAGPLPGCW